MVLLIPVVALVTLLVVFHTMLLIKNLTTYEHVRTNILLLVIFLLTVAKQISKTLPNNPYNVGPVMNIIRRCCADYEPRYVVLLRTLTYKILTNQYSAIFPIL